jgi:hypothetical protein
LEEIQMYKKKHWIWFFIIANLLLGLITTNLKAEGTWVRKTDMPTPRDFLGTAVVDGIIYAIGGTSNQVLVPTVEAYDPATDTWTKKADMPESRAFLTTNVVNGKIYAIGGWTGHWVTGRFASTVEEYDPKTDKWTSRSEIPTSRDSPTSSVADGIIYAIGGHVGGGRSTSIVEAYDPATDNWEKKANMPTARWTESPALALDGLIYVIGGQTAGNANTNAVEVYDPASDTWNEETDRPAWAAGSVEIIGDKIYSLGPTAGGSYDPSAKIWSEEPSMPFPNAPYYRSSVASVNDKIYVMGGSINWGGAGLAIVEEFTPKGWPFKDPSPVSPQSKLHALWGKLKVSQ